MKYINYALRKLEDSIEKKSRNSEIILIPRFDFIIFCNYVYSREDYLL